MFFLLLSYCWQSKHASVCFELYTHAWKERRLSFHESGIGGTELLKVGQMLQSNTNMDTLFIYSRSDNDMEHIMFETVSSFIDRIVVPDSLSHLRILFIHSCHMEHLKCDMNIQNDVNRFALIRGLPLRITLLM